VMFRMRKGHEERNDSQHQHHRSNQHQSFHGIASR
jgi:hypothetical protein